ncbi:DUF6452 family protein [Dokdonia sp. Hel_I_53]|uniref:DUF6452 family protein n=1 Tax=Dokdonia sp. Hel_I_53 TaxID=1566287 RepID=UPI0011996BA3|nr:DUF6452 family protein [Dokdonia sp. Hel_I_53]TVZ51833.1 hypothetical protein OD90_0987 [Dokdonia sp. Hel_I_53]
MRKLILLFLLIIGLLHTSCERDDICAATTQTTPLLRIEFYDANNISILKAPTNLEITTAVEGGDTLALVNTSSVAIPLNTSVDQLVYSFKINSLEVDEDEENTDDLAISYIRQEDFVSSACGFRVIYNDLEITRDALNDGNWIQDIDILNTIIDNDTITHVTIFH